MDTKRGEKMTSMDWMNGTKEPKIRDNDARMCDILEKEEEE